MTHPAPIYRIEVDGKDISSIVRARLVRLTLTENRGFDADQLDLSLDDSDGKLDLPPKGAKVHIHLGWAGSGLVDKGSYTVDEITHEGPPDTLTLRARSADLRSGLTTQRERSWHDTTVGDIVRTIASENGLIPMVAESLAGKVIDHLDQTNESDANLLTRLAGQFDAIATVKSGRLLFIPAGGGVSASGKPLAAITITRQSGDRHHFNVADRESYTHVKATWHDTDKAIKGEVIWGKAEDDAESNRTTQITTAATGTYKPLPGTSKSRAEAQRVAKKAWEGMSKARRAGYVGVSAKYADANLKVNGTVTYGTADELKKRRSAASLAEQDAARTGAPVVAIEGGADNTKTLRHVYASLEAAKRAARTEWRRLQRGMAAFNITLALGRMDLTPEQPATVQGFKPTIDSTDWILAKLTHALNDSGLTTRADLEIKATELPG